MAPNNKQRARDSSLELGDAVQRQQYNKQGRPIRRSAGKKKKSMFGYVDSTVIEIEDDDLADDPSGDDDGETRKPARKKYKRGPSPSPPPLDPIMYNDEPDELSDGEPRNVFSRNAREAPITLQFNVPLGYHGPLVVKLDRSMLNAPKDEGYNVYPPPGSESTTSSPSAQDANAKDAAKDMFASLPPEIRNKLYETLFVVDGDLKLYHPHNFKRSAQFLRTCKLVHKEGCSVLYGKNKFVFERNKDRRAPFFEPTLKEIGYTDVRRFLRMIGPESLSFLRHVKITFEDAYPASTPYLPSHEARRYVNDDYLIDCLRTLSRTKLQTLILDFRGRRMLQKTDNKFLSYLEQIKADEVKSSNTPEMRIWYGGNKICDLLWTELKEVMTRKKKLYADKK